MAVRWSIWTWSGEKIVEKTNNSKMKTVDLKNGLIAATTTLVVASCGGGSNEIYVGINYLPENAHDFSFETAWVEGRLHTQ